MISKEKLISLSKYRDSLKDKLKDPTVPEKHKNRHAQYRQYLTNELAAAEATLEKGKV